MEEIEIKILDVNEKEIKGRIMSFGAKKTANELIIEKYYDFDDGRISKNKGLFRLRKAGEKIEFAYKIVKNTGKDFLEFEEYETKVDDFDIMEIIIDKLGFKCIINRQKKRITFAINKLKFEIHKYPTIPAYLEIEGTKEEIIKFLKLLNYKMEDTTSMTDTDILKFYKKDYAFQKF